MRIDQYLPNFAPHDAIGNHVLQVRRALRGAGVDSDIYAEVIQGSLRREARHYSASPAPAGDRLALYHASTHGEVAGWLGKRAEAGERLLVWYHNITPAEYFERWLPAAASDAARARAELLALAPHVELALADSRFNEAELSAAGYAATVTSPLLVDLDTYRQAPDGRVAARLRRRRASGGADWLFVGRVAPNKCQHDVIAAFAVYRGLFDPAARLTLVGLASSARYFRALLELVDQLELSDSVAWLDRVPHRELLARFAAADVLVCLSEHEGFCVPLLEAMTLGVPVVAYAAAAVPETVGDAGVLLEGKDPLEVAGAVADLLGDPARRDALVAAGRERAAGWALDRNRERMLSALAGPLGRAPAR